MMKATYEHELKKKSNGGEMGAGGRREKCVA